MKTTNTYMGSAAILNHISGTKTETSGPDKNGDNCSGERNTPCILIFIKDRIISCKNLLAAAFNNLKFEYIKDTAVSERCIFFKGREMYMRTGESPGYLRNSPSYYWDSPAADRKITELKRSFSEVIRSLSGLLRRIPEVLRSLPEKHGNFPGSCRKIPGLFSRLSEGHREIPVQRSNFAGSYKVMFKATRSFPGPLRGFSEGSGERLKRI